MVVCYSGRDTRTFSRQRWLDWIAPPLVREQSRAPASLRRATGWDRHRAGGWWARKELGTEKRFGRGRPDKHQVKIDASSESPRLPVPSCQCTRYVAQAPPSHLVPYEGPKSQVPPVPCRAKTQAPFCLISDVTAGPSGWLSLRLVRNFSLFDALCLISWLFVHLVFSCHCVQFV